MNHDAYYMARALKLARYQTGRTGINPSVGCIIVDRRGNLLAEATTGDGGQPHAEELALARLSKEESRGGTAFVTLEPCRERSTDTASCSDRLIKAGITRIVIATHDPHPNGRGGADRLRAAGIRVELGLMKTEADLLYEGFFASVVSNQSAE